MPSNADIARIFSEMAAVMELTGANPFRTNAYANAARVINDHTANLGELSCDKKKLLAIEGIGEGTASKIIEFCQTGQVAEHAKLIAMVPPGLSLPLRSASSTILSAIRSLMELPGLKVSSLAKTSAATSPCVMRLMRTSGVSPITPRMLSATREWWRTTDLDMRKDDPGHRSLRTICESIPGAVSLR